MLNAVCPGCNVAPYDAVESPDTKYGRPDWVRSDCRLCGRFLGFRPPADWVEKRRAGPKLEFASEAAPEEIEEEI